MVGVATRRYSYESAIRVWVGSAFIGIGISTDGMGGVLLLSSSKRYSLFRFDSHGGGSSSSRHGNNILEGVQSSGMTGSFLWLHLFLRQLALIEYSVVCDGLFGVFGSGVARLFCG